MRGMFGAEASGLPRSILQQPPRSSHMKWAGWIELEVTGWRGNWRTSARVPSPADGSAPVALFILIYNPNPLPPRIIGPKTQNSQKLLVADGPSGVHSGGCILPALVSGDLSRTSEPGSMASGTN